ncbi:YobA family protein [Paenibacillus sp. GCM10028914]|uniref:YobA family protein n=1 Tax=Paenibacillus sp. GCM10028914 TaxID=3273416 RepID=UPI00360AA072
MRSVLLTVLSLFISLSLFGCSSSTSNSGSGTDVKDVNEHSNKDSAPGMEGYVVDQQDGEILVVDSVPKNYSASGGKPEFYNAIWFSYGQKNVAVGQKVQVWFNLVKQSYPGQSTAEKLRVVPAPKPDQANIDEAEAIRQALAEPAEDNPAVPVIKAVKYDEASDKWMVSIKRGDEVTDIQIDDK